MDIFFSRVWDILNTFVDFAVDFWEWGFTPIVLEIGSNTYSIDAPLLWLLGSAILIFLVARIIRALI